MSLPQPERVAWVCYGKGIGIFLVVLGHTIGGLQACHIADSIVTFEYLNRWIYSFHMPLFFFLSGMFAETQVHRDDFAFLKAKSASLIYPYLIWSSITLLLGSFFSKHMNHPVGLLDAVGILFYPIMQFWFLYVLLLVAVAYHFLRRHGMSPFSIALVFAIAWLAKSPIANLGWSPLIASRVFGIYYALGALFQIQNAAFKLEDSRLSRLILLTISGFFVVSAAAIWPKARADLTILSAISGILATAALSVYLDRSRIFRFVHLLGEYSLEIYLMHTIVSAGIRLALQRLFLVQDLSIHLILGTTGGLVIPLIFAAVCSRFRLEYLFRLPKRQSFAIAYYWRAAFFRV